MTFENIDSREGFNSDEELAYTEGWGYDPTDEDYEEMCDYFDGQPDEYTEWQDFMGGDDWDHGQYDEYC